MMRFPPSWMSLLILPPGGDSGLDGQVRISIFAVPGRNLTVRERNTHRPLGDPGSFSSVPGGRLDFCSFLGFRRCPFSHDEDMQRAGATLNSAFAASEGRQAVFFLPFCFLSFFLISHRRPPLTMLFFVSRCINVMCDGRDAEVLKIELGNGGRGRRPTRVGSLADDDGSRRRERVTMMTKEAEENYDDDYDTRCWFLFLAFLVGTRALL